MSLLDKLPLVLEEMIYDYKHHMEQTEHKFKKYYKARMKRVLRQLKHEQHPCACCGKCWDKDDMYKTRDNKYYCDDCFFYEYPSDDSDSDYSESE